MSTLIKTVQTELLPITLIAANANFVGAPFDVSTKFGGTFLWDFAAISTQATPAQTEFSVQASQKAAGNDTWVNVFTWLSSGVVGVNQTVSGGGGAGTTTITLTPTLGAVNVYFFLKNATLLSSEWSRRIAIAGAGPFVVTTEDAFTNTQTAAASWTPADRYKFDIDFSSITRIRIMIGNNRSAAVNRDVVCRVALITADAMA
jgi:hypothetical protein